MKILRAVLCSIPLATAIPSYVFGATADRCEQLIALAQPDTIISAAQAVDAGRYTPPGPAAAVGPLVLPAFCRVAAALKTTSDCPIRIEVWDAASGWNGKFLGVGNRGWGRGASSVWRQNTAAR